MEKTGKKKKHPVHYIKKKKHGEEKKFGPLEIMLPADLRSDEPVTQDPGVPPLKPCQPEQRQAEQQTPADNYRFYSNRKYFTICIYALFLVAASALIIYGIMNLPKLEAGLKRFIGVLFPFFVAFFIAYILNPLVKRFDSDLFGKRFGWKPCGARLLVSLVLSYLIVIGIITVALLYVFPQLGTSIADLTNRIPDLMGVVIEFIAKLDEHYPELDLNKLEEYLTMSIPDLISYGTNIVKNVVPMILNVGVWIVRLTINLLLSVVISCYMIFDKRSLAKNASRILYALLPPARASAFTQTAGECNKIFSSFIVGKSIDSLIIGILCFILMTIFKFPYAILISVIVGVTNMIPYFGPFIGAVPGILLYLCLDPVKAFFFALLIFALQQFDGWFLGPKILGDSTGLTPLWVIFGITVGGAYHGVLGMFLGVPVVAVIAHLCSKWLAERLKRKKIEIR